MRRPLRFGAFIFFAICLACDDKPKAQTQGPATPQPIPSDLVYNSGFEDKGASAKAIVVSDSGAATSPTSAPSGGPVKLESAGADPKSPLVYAFAAKTRTVNVTLKISQSSPNGNADQSFKFGFTATPKPKLSTSGDATVDLKITKLDMELPANAPPQAAAQKDQLQKAIIGVGGHFDVTSHGEISDPVFEADKAGPGAAEMTQIVQQSLELMVVPLPSDAIGVGAKWTKHEAKNLADEGTSVSGSVTMTLLARDAQTATIKVEANNSGTMAVTDPRAPKGTAVQRSSTSSYTVVIRLDGVSQKVDGESKNDITQKVPGQPDQAMTVKLSQTIESK